MRSILSRWGFRISNSVLQVEIEDGASPADNIPLVLKKRRKRPMVMLSTETEEEIETLEQKLKIAKRKGHDDKAKKLASRLEKLRLGRPGEDYSEDALTSPRSKTPTSDYNSESFGERRGSYKTLDSIVIVLEPRQIRAVAVSFRAVEIEGVEDTSPVSNLSQTEIVPEGLVSGNIIIHEAKNTDVVKYV
jgi:hypothetical protein